MRKIKNNKKFVCRNIAIAMFAILSGLNCWLYASDIEKVSLEKKQDQNVSALQGKTILTGSGLSVDTVTNLKEMEEARLRYILKREEIQKERLTNTRLKCS